LAVSDIPLVAGRAASAGGISPARMLRVNDSSAIVARSIARIAAP
jgi:hypothetical protein